jgi:hypothetical protein
LYYISSAFATAFEKCAYSPRHFFFLPACLSARLSACNNPNAHCTWKFIVGNIIKNVEFEQFGLAVERLREFDVM